MAIPLSLAHVSQSDGSDQTSTLDGSLVYLTGSGSTSVGSAGCTYKEYTRGRWNHYYPAHQGRCDRYAGGKSNYRRRWIPRPRAGASFRGNDGQSIPLLCVARGLVPRSWAFVHKFRRRWIPACAGTTDRAFLFSVQRGGLSPALGHSCTSFGEDGFRASRERRRANIPLLCVAGGLSPACTWAFVHKFRKEVKMDSRVARPVIDGPRAFLFSVQRGGLSPAGHHYVGTGSARPRPRPRRTVGHIPAVLAVCHVEDAGRLFRLPPE